MHKSFKQFREERDIIEFGRKYDNLCYEISESGMKFDQFWIEHGLPILVNNGATGEEQLVESWADAARGGVAALGTLGKQTIRGGYNALTGAAQTGYGALQAGAGIGKAALGGGGDTFQNGMSNMGRGLVRTGSGLGQVALAPVSAGIRGYEAGQQQGTGMNAGNQLQQWMGTRTAQQQAQPNQQQAQPNQQQAQPNQQQAQPNQQQAQPQPQPQPNQPLNKNQTQASKKAMQAIRTQLNQSMQSLTQSQDPAVAKLATDFMTKINNYLDKAKVMNGPQVFSQPQIQPTVGASAPTKMKPLPGWPPQSQATTP
jgi:hypothetical protein